MSFKQKRSICDLKTAVQADISSELEVMQEETVSFPSSSGQLFDEYVFSARGWKFGKSDLIDANGRAPVGARSRQSSQPGRATP
jgi:hypothetical protein